jgi:hypothetical protein
LVDALMQTAAALPGFKQHDVADHATLLQTAQTAQPAPTRRRTAAK